MRFETRQTPPDRREPFAPGFVINHVMVRNPSGLTIFQDRLDRDDLLASVSALALENRAAVYAWAILSNHFHLLLRTAVGALGLVMREMLAGFRDRIGRRRDDAAAIVPDRWHADACLTGRHFVDVVRYIHLNPLRAGIVRSVDELDDYPYSGHSAVVAAVPRDWQATAVVLARFGRTPGWGLAAYRKFLCDGAAEAWDGRG